MSTTRVPNAADHIERMLYGSRVGKPREIFMYELIHYDKSGIGFGFRCLVPPFAYSSLDYRSVLEGVLTCVNGPVHLKRAAKLAFRDAVRGEVRTRKEFVRRLDTYFRRPHPALGLRSRPHIRGTKVEELLAFAGLVSTHPQAEAMAECLDGVFECLY